MRRIRIQYDAYNRQFKLLDRSGATLRDGEIYLVLDDSALDFNADLDSVYEQELEHA
jgi:hypothetical protein